MGRALPAIYLLSVGCQLLSTPLPAVPWTTDAGKGRDADADGDSDGDTDADADADADADGDVDAGADAGRDACTPSCEGRACGDDGCGSSCGECVEPRLCDGQACACPEGRADCAGTCCAPGQCCAAGLCISPYCDPGWQCGGDGCGGSCGGCAAHLTCLGNRCLCPDGRADCSGTCCPAGQCCQAGACLEPFCDPNWECGGDGCGGPCGPGCGDIAIPPDCWYCVGHGCTQGSQCDNACCWPFEMCDAGNCR